MEFRACGGKQIIFPGAVRACTARHVGLASTLASHQGCEGFDQVPGPVSRALSFRPAESPKVKLFPIIDDQDGGSGEPDFFQAIEQFLKEGRRPFKGLNDCGRMSVTVEEG